MTNGTDRKIDDLNKKAQKMLESDPRVFEKMDKKEMMNVLQELHIHEIELELHNEELRRTQVELERIRQKYTNLFHYAPIGYAVLNDVGMIKEANRTFAKMVCHESSDLINKAFADYMSPEYQSIFRSRYSSLIKNPEGKSLEVSFNTGKDDFIFARLETKALNTIEEGGNDTEERKLLITVSDITERKLAEDERKKAQEEILREREQLLSIFASIDEVIYTSDPETYEILFVNPAFEKILGKDVVGGICYKEFQGLDAPCEFCTNSIILENNYKPHMWEYYNSKLDKHFMITDRIINWSDDREVRFEMALDITALKQTEKKIARQIKFEKAVANASKQLLVEDESEFVVNDALEILLETSGVSRIYIFENFEDPSDGLCMKQTYEVCAADVAPEIHNPELKHVIYSQGFERWQKVLSAGKNIKGHISDFPQREREILGPQGIISILIIPIMVNGKWWGFIGFDENRFKREWVESEVTLLSTATEMFGRYFMRRISQKERAKLEIQLQQSQKMESIGLLAGGVAHDFNNLLTSITGNVSLALMDVSKEDPLRESLEQIRQAADSAALLTQQLLAFSRKQLISPKVTDLNVLIDHSFKMLGRIIGEDVNLRFHPHKSLGKVKVDHGQFEQILINLAVNARDAMPEGGNLTLETNNVSFDDSYSNTHTHVKPGEYVMIAVSDDGVGMSEDVRSRLFEPFFTTKPKDKGTGLGLATVYGTVKQNDGYIEVYSEKDEGTTFKVYFPKVEAQADAIEGLEKSGDLPKGTEKILIVEDENIVRTIAAKALSRQGYNVYSAASGEEALNMFDDDDYEIDLLITDVIMPKMNGRELSEKILVNHPQIAVLFTSGYTENVIGHHGVLEAGINFIGKPYTPQALARKVREVLDKKHYA